MPLLIAPYQARLPIIAIALVCYLSPVSAEMVSIGRGYNIDTDSVHNVGIFVRYSLESTEQNPRRVFVDVDCKGRTRLEYALDGSGNDRQRYTVANGTRVAEELDAACKLAEIKSSGQPGARLESATSSKNAEQAATVDPSYYCFNALESDANLKVLLPRVGTVSLAAPRNVTFDMMVSRALPTKAEKDAVKYWGAMQQQCAEQGQAFRASKTPQAYVLAYNDFQRKGMLLLAKLYGGNLNYGQFVAERESLANEINQKIAAIIQELQERARAQAQAEAQAAQALARAQAESEAQARARADAEARSAAYAQALADAERARANREMFNLGVQLLTQQPMQPRMISPTVNCRSWQAGNTVQTQCN